MSGQPTSADSAAYARARSRACTTSLYMYENATTTRTPTSRGSPAVGDGDTW